MLCNCFHPTQQPPLLSLLFRAPQNTFKAEYCKREELPDPWGHWRWGLHYCPSAALTLSQLPHFARGLVTTCITQYLNSCILARSGCDRTSTPCCPWSQWLSFMQNGDHPPSSPGSIVAMSSPSLESSPALRSSVRWKGSLDLPVCWPRSGLPIATAREQTQAPSFRMTRGKLNSCSK